MDRVTLVMTAVSAGMFFLIVLLVLVNIVGRSFFNSPVKGTVEMVQYGVMLCAGFVMCRSGLEGRHIVVSVLIDRFPVRLHELFVALGRLVGLAAFAMLAWLNYTKVPDAIASGKVTDAFRAPFQYIYLAMSVCFAIGALVFFYQFCESLVGIAHGRRTDRADAEDADVEQAP
ncbi:MAG: TRAP transporter small permease [Clostridiales Family XIII bacterium]|nr:TRAP transporter small permease [Clostridiales Family XIII bacterium]